MKKILALSLAVLLALSINIKEVEAAEYNVNRLEGSSRIETSIEISKRAYAYSSTVLLTGYKGQVDALSGTLLARVKDAPILITNKEDLSSEVLKEIRRLGATEIIILGGENAVSKKVEESLIGFKIERIEGSNREQTAVNIAKKSLGANVNEVFLALGYEEYADALAIGPVSGSRRIPIYLTQTKKLPQVTIDALKASNVQKVNIIGGNTVISPQIEQTIKSMNIQVERISGPAREETAIAIAKKFNPGMKNLVLANGYKYADAVVGGYFTSKMEASILLTQDSKMKIENYEFIQENKKDLFILGGLTSVSSLLEKDLRDIVERGVTVKEEEHTFIEPFETITKTVENLATGERKVIREGIDGSRLSRDRIYFKGGLQIKRINLFNKITKEAVDQIVHIGK
nr:cell wall-binding repeat-containing protein [Tissierella sp.]